jgi:hypothetical protein
MPDPTTKPLELSSHLISFRSLNPSIKARGEGGVRGGINLRSFVVLPLLKVCEVV